MSNLETRLARIEERDGKDSPLAQMIRNQIAAKKSGQSFQEMYLTGSYKKPRSADKTPPVDALANDKSLQEENLTSPSKATLSPQALARRDRLLKMTLPGMQAMSLNSSKGIK